MSTTATPTVPSIGGLHRSVDERIAIGKAARKVVPRSAHGAWDPAQRTHDPIALLQQQAEARVPELVPIRHGRMSASAFANYRGAALMMAADLATAPSTGLDVQLCGDAHLSNFGGFASPERKLVFDLNDFDETLPGPFEWDVKRLVASVDVAGRANGFDDALRTDMVLGTARAYREAMAQFAAMRDLEVWYSSLDVEAVLMEGYRRVDEWHLIERAIDDFDLVFLRNEDSVAQMGRGRLTREELVVLELVNGKHTVQDIIHKTRMGSFEVSKMLYRLLSIKLIRRRVQPVAV